MRFFFYLMIEVRKMEVLTFALLLIEANATIKLLNVCVYIFLRCLSQKACSPLFIGVLAIKEGNKCKCK